MLISQDFQTLQKSYDFDSITKATGQDFVKSVKNSVTRRNQNKIINIVGMPGSGKSWACLRLAEVLDPQDDFDPHYIAYTKKDFYNIINSGFKRGQPIVYEETGVNESNRSFWDNKETNDIMQTFRRMNAILLTNTPMHSFQDKQQRELSHAVFSMGKIFAKKKQSILHPFFTETNPVNGQKRMGWCTLKGDLISEIILNAPSKQLLKEYEARKKEFGNALNQRSLVNNIQREKKRKIETKMQVAKAKRMGVTF
jgi:hypothetical protein